MSEQPENRLLEKTLHILDHSFINNHVNKKKKA